MSHYWLLGSEESFHLSFLPTERTTGYWQSERFMMILVGLGGGGGGCREGLGLREGFFLGWGEGVFRGGEEEREGEGEED